MLFVWEEEPRLRTVEMVFRGHQAMTRGAKKDSCLATGWEGHRFIAVKHPQERGAGRGWGWLDHGS